MEYENAKIYMTYNGLKYAVDQDLHDELTINEIKKLEFYILSSELFPAFLAFWFTVAGFFFAPSSLILSCIIGVGCFLGISFQNTYAIITNRLLKLPLKIFILCSRFQLHNIIIFLMSYFLMDSLKPFASYALIRLFFFACEYFLGNINYSNKIPLHNKLCEAIIFNKL